MCSNFRSRWIRLINWIQIQIQLFTRIGGFRSDQLLGLTIMIIFTFTKSSVILDTTLIFYKKLVITAIPGRQNGANFHFLKPKKDIQIKGAS